MSMPDVFRVLNDLGFQSFRIGLSFLWQSTVLLAAVLVVSRLFRRRSAEVLHMLWLVAFVLLPILPLSSWITASLGAPAMTIRVMPPRDAYREEMARLWALRLASFGTAESTGVMGNSTPIAPYPEDPLAVSHSGPDLASPSIRLSLWGWGMILYLGMALFLLARIAAGWIRLRRCVRTGSVVTEEPVLDLFRTAARRLALRRDFVVLTSPHFPSPLTIGVFHPIIILPPEMAGPQGLADLRTIALHELAHIRRHDPLTLLVVSLLRAMFFIHPLLWAASRKISLLAERACDDAVLETTGEPLSYAKTLARIAERIPSRHSPLIAAAGLFVSRSLFLHRIEAILSERRVRMHPISRWTIAGIVASSAFVFTLACSIPLGERRLRVVIEDSDITRISEFSQHAVAYAVPLSGITVDGGIGDWPKDLARYPIRNHDSAYGPSDIDTVDLDVSRDLSPEMMVGYSPEENLLYFAVMVRDDSVYVERNPVDRNCFMSDACEIYVDGAHIPKRFPLMKRGTLPVRQYVMCPEGGAYSNFIDAPNPLVNPNLAYGDITRTRTTSACVRKDGITTYEWAVELFDRYPDAVTKLLPGKVVGMDVAVVDRDNDATPVNNPAGGNSAWVCWAQYGILKAYDTDLLGDLVLLDSRDRVGTIRGKVTYKETGKKSGGLDIDVLRDGKPAGRVKTGPNGGFEIPMPSGRYTLKPHPGQGVREISPETVEVIAGNSVDTELYAAIR